MKTQASLLATLFANALAAHGTAGASAPLLVAAGGERLGLQAWAVGPLARATPFELPGSRGLLGYGGMASDGARVVIGNGTTLAVYDLRARRLTFVPDRFGHPLDVAFGRDGTLYVANLRADSANVAVYPRNAAPRQVGCAALVAPDHLAVDDEGDIFVTQNGARPGVVEIPAGPNGPDGARCTALALDPGVAGYAAGVAIDPKTDDLLVLDNPSRCAGGLEGRVTVYRRPYGRARGRSLVLGRNCASGLKLSAGSTLLYLGDEGTAGPPEIILQYGYPSGRYLGAYGGGEPGAFVPLPAPLPN